MVVTALPSAWTASTVHDFTDMPSRSTVQDPHWDVSQAIFVPVSPTWSRMKSTNSVRASTSASRRTPFTVIATSIGPPSVVGRHRDGRSARLFRRWGDSTPRVRSFPQPTIPRVAPDDAQSAFAQAAAEDGIVLGSKSFDWLCEQGHVGLLRVAKLWGDPALVDPVTAAVEHLGAIYARLKGDISVLYASRENLLLPVD